MAPKRKTIQNDNISRPVTRCRISKQLARINTNDETTIDTMASSKKKQMKKKNKTKPIVNRSNKTNSEIIIGNSESSFLVLFFIYIII